MLALALTVGFVSSAAARPSGAAAIAGLATFTDPTGDAQGAPDLASVTINGDPATGTITFAVTASGFFPASPDGLKRAIIVFLDTDKNGSTGELGFEYVLAVWNDSTGRWWNMERWDGSSWQYMPQSATSSFAGGGNVYTWTLSAADLGGATGFAFVAGALTLDASGNPTGVDRAPDIGTWTYDISAAAAPPPPPTTTSAAPTTTMYLFLTPVIGKPVTVPARVMAGKRVTVSFPVTRSDDGKPLASGKMVCDPSVAGKVVPHTESFKGGVARLSFVVPKTAKGKQLTVKLTITAPSYQGKDATEFDVSTGQTKTVTTQYSGQSATRIASFPIR